MNPGQRHRQIAPRFNDGVALKRAILIDLPEIPSAISIELASLVRSPTKKFQ